MVVPSWIGLPASKVLVPASIFSIKLFSWSARKTPIPKAADRLPPPDKQTRKCGGAERPVLLNILSCSYKVSGELIIDSRIKPRSCMSSKRERAG